jgi:hypothetical protein
MNLHAMHIDLTLRVVAVVAAFFVLIAAFLAIDVERIIRRLDDIREVLRKDDKREGKK